MSEPALYTHCDLCGGELFDAERLCGYCEDCRDSGDLEDVLERALSPNRSESAKPESLP